MTEQTTQSLEAQIAALTKQVEERKATQAAADHFVDSAGEAVTNSTALNDAVLRAAGVAMQGRGRVIDGWKETPVDEVESALAVAVAEKQYVDVALFAAVLHAKQALSAASASVVNNPPAVTAAAAAA